MSNIRFNTAASIAADDRATLLAAAAVLTA